MRLDTKNAAFLSAAFYFILCALVCSYTHRGTPARLRSHPPRSLARWPLSASEHIYAVYWHPCAPVLRCLVDAPLPHTRSRLLLLPPLALVWPARPWFLVRPHHTSLRRGAPAFAVLGIAAPPRPAPHPIPLPARPPLAPARLPHWPTIRAPAHNCRPQHNPLRTPCARPSYLQLHTAPPRIILPPRAPPAPLARFRTTSLPEDVESVGIKFSRDVSRDFNGLDSRVELIDWRVELMMATDVRVELM
ncbi:hypothetical protein B0H14DRAFT_3727851 [Mycena olivaceomarginata]|nr:hypothetical protein B0H14DRAFT_3727851 [Mycena olivaceomarginata]